MKTIKRIWLRIVCQFINHDVQEFKSFSCQCRRCGKGWHPNTYFAGPCGQAWTLRNFLTTIWEYFK